MAHEREKCAERVFEARLETFFEGRSEGDASFASTAELAGLRAIAARGMALGGGDGGPTILDLQSGALSWRDKFIDVWSAFNATGTPAFRKSEVRVYANVVGRIRALAERPVSDSPARSSE